MSPKLGLPSRKLAASAVIGAAIGIGAMAATHSAPLVLAPTASTSSGAVSNAASAPTGSTVPVGAPPFANANGSAGANPNIYVDVARKTVPSVVNIFTTKTVRMQRMRSPFPNDPFGEMFGEMFGRSMRQPQPEVAPAPKAQSLGSGFVLDVANGEAMIVTNNHVIEGADEIQVKFTESPTEKGTVAKLVGTDPELDVALLSIKTASGQKLQALPLGDSDQLQVGEYIAAVGNPFGHGHSITHGIVSAKERSLPGAFGKYLQVDAPINPGNSGGPLVNLAGEVVGINNAIDARASGIGFAIPVNAAKAAFPQLKSKGRIERGYLGVNIDELNPEIARNLKVDEALQAPVVVAVEPSSPGARAGLKPYDVITAVNQQPVTSATDLITAIRSLEAGSQAEIKLLRAGKERSISVRLDARPRTQQES